MNTSRAACIAALAGMAVLGAESRVNAQTTAADFYKGKSITILVGSSAGGGYDTWARLIARYMSKHTPGNPNFLVSNMPGAGSNLAANYIYNVAPKDGTFVGAIYGGAPLESARRRSSTIPRRHNISAAPTTMFTSASRARTRPCKSSRIS